MIEIVNLSLPGPKRIQLHPHYDERGFFVENYREPLYKELGIDPTFLQDNHSFSKGGTLRGMHFQSHPGQAKLVSVALGLIYDVVVDIRLDSPHFGKWEGIYLDSEKHEQLYIPVGFAHGFAVLSAFAHVSYKVSSLFNPETEITFCYSDPEVGIEWPLSDPILSEKDRNAPSLKEVVSRENLNLRCQRTTGHSAH